MALAFDSGTFKGITPEPPNHPIVRFVASCVNTNDTTHWLL